MFKIEDLKSQLEDAERRAIENYEMATSSDSRYEHKVSCFDFLLTNLESLLTANGKVASLKASSHILPPFPLHTSAPIVCFRG